MSEIEKRELLESIKRLPPEKQTYVAGIAAGLAMSEKETETPVPDQDEPTPE